MNKDLNRFLNDYKGQTVNINNICICQIVGGYEFADGNSFIQYMALNSSAINSVAVKAIVSVDVIPWENYLKLLN